MRTPAMCRTAQHSERIINGAKEGDESKKEREICTPNEPRVATKNTRVHAVSDKHVLPNTGSWLFSMRLTADGRCSVARMITTSRKEEWGAQTSTGASAEDDRLPLTRRWWNPAKNMISRPARRTGHSNALHGPKAHGLRQWGPSIIN